jgi:polysaccharide export outer membrane protein
VSLLPTHRRSVLAALLLSLVLAPAIGAQARVLQPGDALRIRVFRELELSGEFQINELGVVTLPRLGEIRILEWPLDSIRPRLQRLYAAYLREPTVEVAFLRRVTIYGSVMKPGLYPVDPTMTVQDALALAGGPTMDGMRDRVELIRGGTRVVQRLSMGTRLEQSPLESGDQIFVPQRSWLARNTWLVSSLIAAATTIIAFSSR